MFILHSSIFNHNHQLANQRFFVSNQQTATARFALIFKYCGHTLAFKRYIVGCYLIESKCERCVFCSCARSVLQRRRLVSSTTFWCRFRKLNLRNTNGKICMHHHAFNKTYYYNFSLKINISRDIQESLSATVSSKKNSDHNLQNVYIFTEIEIINARIATSFTGLTFSCNNNWIKVKTTWYITRSNQRGVLPK